MAPMINATLQPVLKHRARVAIASLAILIACPAWAQVAPPPSKKPAPVREYTPPPRPQVAPPTPRPRPQPNPAPRPRELPEVEYESLVQYDEEGKLIRLNEPPTIAAIRVNPLIDDELKPAITDVLSTRNALFRELTVQYIDDAIAVDNGLIESLRLEQRDDLQGVLAAVERLSTRTAEQELSDLDIISDDAAAFTRKIATEYLNALRNELLGEIDPEAVFDGAAGPQDVTVQMMFRQHLEEAMNSYTEIAQAMPAFVSGGGLESLGLSDEQRSTIEPLVTRLKSAASANDAKERRQATGLIIQHLDESQRQNLLEGMFRK
ncbi:MAG: hypothetical protein AAGK04_06605 [Planctomycetota bacterium]